MQNAECRMQNDLTTLRFAHKERMISAERGVRNAERLCSAELRKQGNYYIIIPMSVVQRSEDNSAFCVLHSALTLKRVSLDARRNKGRTPRGCCTSGTAP